MSVTLICYVAENGAIHVVVLLLSYYDYDLSLTLEN